MPKTDGFRGFVMRAALLAVVAFAPRVATAELRPFHGTLRFMIGSLDPITIEGSGTADVTMAPLGTSIQNVEVDAGVFSETGITRTVDPSLFPIAGVHASAANQAGGFERSAPGNHLHGVMPISGVARVCLFAGCDEGPLANLSIPLSVIGVGGTVTGTDEVNLTVRGAPWTTATIAPIGGGTFSTVGPRGGTHQSGGKPRLVALVTPILISSNLGAYPTIGSYAYLELDFWFACSDGLDNDADGLIDLADTGCAHGIDNNEFALPACSDLLDNDGDGAIDVPADLGCESAADDDERGTGVCDDGIDQDGDAVADLPSDPGCSDLADASEQSASVACDNGSDDDGDGLIDHSDPGCVGSADPDEHALETACDDGADQDGDGFIDFPADDDCASADDGVGGPDVAACQNGIDDDADGQTDAADPACAGPEDVEEAILLADGIAHTLDATTSLPTESLRVADGPDAAQTRLDLGPGVVVGHRLHATQHSFVSIQGGTLGGDLFATDESAVEIGGGTVTSTIRTQSAASVLLRGGPVSGALEVRGNSQLTILGWVPNRVGTVPQLGGTITGTLADGTPLNLAFLREPSATITIPEPDAGLALAIALAAVSTLAWRPSGRPRG